MTTSMRFSTIPQLLGHNARHYGQAPAFSSPGRLVTHHDLESRTRCIACRLRAAGVRRGDHVIVLLDRCVEAVESILAIVRAGGIAVPLDPRCSQAELATIFDNVGPEHRWIVTNAAGAKQVRSVDDVQRATIWIVDNTPTALSTKSFDSLLACNDASNTPDDLAGSDKAFIHYTSGSTGLQPKGVVSSQQAYIHSATTSSRTHLKVRHDDKILCPLPITHAYGFTMGVILALCTAASTYLTGDQSLAQSLAKDSHTIVIGVPATYSELLSLDTSEYDLSSVRLCITSGAPTPPTLNAQVEERLGVTLLNQYGCTETCGIIAVCKPEQPFVEDSCGPPVPCHELRIVHPKTWNDVADGDRGELWIRSPSLMLHYHGQATSPFVDGWYQTGDIARLDDRGNLMITGRVKEMIIRGGQNIHPAEIERVLNDCHAVEEAVVVAASHDIFGEVPAAYVVPANKPLDVASLIDVCRAALPSHKIPVDFFEIDTVPRTKGGKPRRRAAATGSKRRLTLDLMTPATIEAMILEEFCHARGLPTGTLVDPMAQFGDIGMNSLVSIVVRDRLVSVTGLDLAITLLFDFQTPRSLCEHLLGQLSVRSTNQAKSNSPPEQPLPNANEPIAIVAMSCRYPGGICSPEDLWSVVEKGLDVTSDFPIDRGWDIDALYDPDPDTLGTTVSHRGGFIHDMADFDAGLFGMSPREAEATDPQQRLLLESTWNLLERAGLAADSLRGSNTGVYVGIMYNDYATRFTNTEHDLEAQLGPGSAGSVAAGRLSYTFDFHGPSLSIDTACSSSLVAIDLAVKSLKGGECSLAVAGGVTLMATPQAFIVFSRQRGLSPDGRCRSFSDDANGTVWSEGVGLLLLERLSDAQQNGHRVLGLVRGSSTNSDGRSSTLTSPNGAQQECLIQAALQNANLLPADIDVIDGHGTATLLGDPIEARALIATYGQARSEPALLGSVKSNLGHTQAAAGVASIIKMVMAMRHGLVPASLYATKPSRQVDWSHAGIKLLSTAQSWPQWSRPRRAAVSAFGIGGTNAHIILEQGEEMSDSVTSTEACGRSTVAQLCPWLLSGTDETSLREQARAFLGLDGLDPTDVAYSLATTRSPLRWRAAIPPGRVDVLRVLIEGAPHPELLTGRTTAPRLVVLFSGQGGQFSGMADEFCAAFPIFNAEYQKVCDAFDIHIKEPLSRSLRQPETIGRTDIAQAGIFAFQVALFRCLEHFNVVPTYLIGHSVGEITAAHVSGVLSLADATKMVTVRGKLMSAVQDGAMASVEASESEVRTALARLNAPARELTIAAVNSETSVVISGSKSAVTTAMEEFQRRGRRIKRLRINHACHSPTMDAIAPRFLEILRTIPYATSTVPVVSTVSGRVAENLDLQSPEYWARQVVAPVRFADAVQTVKSLGGTAFLEIGPSAALATHVKDAMPTGAKVKTLLDALAYLHVRGSHVTWANVLRGSGAHSVELPTYPFQRRRYWLMPPKHQSNHLTSEHPFIGTAERLPGSHQTVFNGRIAVSEHAWLGQHMMTSKTILPATAFADIAIRAGTDIGLALLNELTLLAPLDLSADGEVHIQMLLAEGSDQERAFEIFSASTRAATAQEWIHHASGILGKDKSRRPLKDDTFDWPAHGEVDISEAYEKLADAGLAYGPAFRCVRQLWRTNEGFVAKLHLADRRTFSGHLVHPTLLDAAMHSTMLATPTEVTARLPFRLAGVHLWPSNERNLRAVVHLMSDDKLSVRMYDSSGRAVAEMETISVRAITAKTGDLFTIQWSPIEMSSRADRNELVVRVRARRAQPESSATIHEAVQGIHRTIQDWWKTKQAQSGQRLVIVTERATTAEPDLNCAAVWGFVRSAQSEFGNSIMLIDVDASSTSETALESAVATSATVLVVQDGRILAPKLIRDVQQHQCELMKLKGTVLVTGGTGALGSILVRHLVYKYGAKRLLLVSRAGPNAPGAASLQAELASRAQVTIKSCDISDYEQVEELIQGVKPPVTAVFHAAGVIDDALLESLTPERISRVLRPKIDAGLNLHHLLRQARPFVLFSSAAGILGNPGQANYAAGNSFLDALARHRAHGGLHALSLAWGPWQNKSGMAAKIPEHGPLLLLSDQQGLDLLDAALLSLRPVLVPLLLRNSVPHISKPQDHRATRNSGDAGSWRRGLTRLSLVDRSTELQRLIRDEIANALGYENLPDLPFTEIGLDSLTSVQIRNRVSILTGVTLPSSVLFDCDNVTQLASLVLEKLDGRAGPIETSTSTKRPDHTQSTKRHEELIPVKKLHLTMLCRQLCNTAHFTEALGMLTIASLTLPTFKLSDAHRHVLQLRHLHGSGSAGAAIVCLPDFYPSSSNISLFRRILPGMGDDIDVFDLAYPVGVLPDSFSTLVDVLVQALTLALPTKRVVLIGYSAGGLVAHTLAHTLKGKLAGLVLVDTYPITENVPNWLAVLPWKRLIEAGSGPEEVYNDTALATMGHYMTLAKACPIEKVPSPTLFLRASEPMPEMKGCEWEASWPHADRIVALPGDHISLLREHGKTTAAEIRRWIESSLSLRQ